MRLITFTHLKKCSGISIREYKARHIGAVLTDADQTGTRNPNWRGGVPANYCPQCRKKIKSGSKTCQTHNSRPGRLNPFFGRRHKQETLDRMAISQQNRDPSTRKTPQVSPEILSAGRRAWWAKIPKEERRVRMEAFVVAGQRHNKRSFGTSIEKAVWKMLEELELPFKTNVKVGPYWVDIVVDGSLVIECFGDYWHSNPAFYDADYYNKSTHGTAYEHWQNDLRRQTHIEELGFTFMSFWEADIRSQPTDVFDKIRVATKHMARSTIPC